jgi:hypothetical protein
MNGALRLRLRELRWISTDRCHAVFESADGQTLETTFIVDRRDKITTASDDRNLMARFQGSAEDTRTIIRAVVALCDAAQ